MSVLSTRLPILATVKAAYGDVFADFPGTLRALSLMFVLLMVFTEVPMLFISAYAEKNILPQITKMQTAQGAGAEMPDFSDGSLDPKMLMLIAVFTIYTLQMIFMFCFTQGWYRQLLFAENKGKVVPLRLGKAEWQLMITSVKVGFAFLPFLLAAMMVMAAAYPNGDFKADPVFNFQPWLGFILGLMLYMQARLALAYPSTVTGDISAPVRQSWNLTKRQGGRIAIGNLMIEIPFSIGLIGFIYLLSWPLTLVLGDKAISNGGVLDLAIRLLFKGIAEFCILVMIAGLTAFHARCYAYLVRSSSNSSVH